MCGRGGIGIRARLRGVFLTEYGFKSRRPHCKENLEAFALRGFLCIFTIHASFWGKRCAMAI